VRREVRGADEVRLRDLRGAVELAEACTRTEGEESTAWWRADGEWRSKCQDNLQRSGSYVTADGSRGARDRSLVGCVGGQMRRASRGRGGAQHYLMSLGVALDGRWKIQ
jgi:hypothetical protein